MAIEYRWAEGHPQRLSALAQDLVRLKVDIIVTSGTIGIRAAKDATSTIPIVFVVLVDPIYAGLHSPRDRPQIQKRGPRHGHSVGDVRAGRNGEVLP